MQSRDRVRHGLMTATLTLASVLLALVLSEALLRAVSPDAYYVWTPYTRGVFRPQFAPGVGGESHFSINQAGIRGDPFTPRQRYRLLAIGGSTTECLLLDDAKAWPHLLQELLNAPLGEGSMWVGNVGRSGLRAPHHQLHVKYLLGQYPRIDALIVLVGINDLQYRLALDADFRPEPLESSDYRVRLMQRAFSELPRRYRSGPLYKRTEMWRRLRALKLLLSGWIGVEPHMQDETGSNLVTWRQHRQGAARLRDSLPDLTPALQEYARQLNGLLDEARRFGTRVILVTQPAIWRPGLPPRVRQLLWMGGVGDFQAQSGKDYYSVEAMARALDRYNQTLLEVCRDRGAECLDLAAALPKDTTIFYDDVHFNEAGAQRVAKVFAAYLLTHDRLNRTNPQ